MQRSTSEPSCRGFKRTVPCETWSLQQDLATPQVDKSNDDAEFDMGMDTISRCIFELNGTYEFIAPIGSQGTVYEVEHPVLGHVALKIGRKCDDGDVPREVRYHFRCGESEYVLPIYHWHRLQGGTCFAIVMPYLLQDDLSTVWGSKTKIQSFMLQLLSALRDCKDAGVIHRDVKPGNILWEDMDERLYLCDFDCATVDPERIHSGSVGTDGFMSPEMRKSTGHTWRSDVYSAGIIFGILLHRLDPHDGPTTAMVKQWATQKRTPAQRLLAKMTHRKPEKRPSYDACIGHEYFSNLT